MSSPPDSNSCLELYIYVMLVHHLHYSFKSNAGHELQSPGELFDLYADNQSAGYVFTVFSLPTASAQTVAGRLPHVVVFFGMK